MVGQAPSLTRSKYTRIEVADGVKHSSLIPNWLISHKSFIRLCLDLLQLIDPNLGIEPILLFSFNWSVSFKTVPCHLVKLTFCRTLKSSNGTPDFLNFHSGKQKRNYLSKLFSRSDKNLMMKFLQKFCRKNCFNKKFFTQVLYLILTFIFLHSNGILAPIL